MLYVHQNRSKTMFLFLLFPKRNYDYGDNVMTLTNIRISQTKKSKAILVLAIEGKDIFH